MFTWKVIASNYNEMWQQKTTNENQQTETETALPAAASAAAAVAIVTVTTREIAVHLTHNTVTFVCQCVKTNATNLL